MEMKENGSLVHDGIVVGKVEENALTINLGWAKAAGLGVKVLGDPDVERRRVVLERPA